MTGKRMTPEEIRQTQLELLDVIMDFCREKHLRCWLCGGSMLGAVRHQGYIPWDDDIDLEMPRKDYMEFLKTFPQNDKYKIFSPVTSPNCYYAFAKFYHDGTIVEENISADHIFGINLDIFPMDNMPDDAKVREKFYNRLKFLQNLLWIKLIKFKRDRPLRKNIVLFFGKLAALPFSKRRLLSIIEKIAQSYASEDNSEYVGTASTLNYGKKEIMRREWWFTEEVLLPFEGRVYSFPGGWHEILTQLYGDYMTPPPENKRRSTHEFVAYWK